jgi:8-oxo-dGTP diphosphatase
MSIPKIAVGGIVVNDGDLLMVRRAKDPGKGLWSIPGGHVEHGEYLTDAVRREVKEETGLDVEVADLVGILEVIGPDHLVILDFGARVQTRTEPAPSDDVSEARWVPLDAVADLECTPRLVETLKGWGVLADE